MTCLLLTGIPGIGKSTVIQRTLPLLGRPAAGFFTRELRAPARAQARPGRTGFEIVTLAGETAVLAHKVQRFRRQVRFRSYYVNLEAIDQIAVPAVKEAVDAGHLAIVDEIGPMELLSPMFCQVVQATIERGTPILGTIVQRRHPLTDPIKEDPSVSLQPVTLTNRESLPATLARRLKEA